MKKRNLMPTVRKTAKSAVALSLAATMIAPAGVKVAADEAADGTTADTATVVVPEPIKEYDFEGGLAEIADDDPLFEITDTEEVYFQKSAEEVEENGEKVDANGLVYVGNATETRYHKGTLSNQPTTAYDEEKGTVLKIGKTHILPAVYKSKNAGIADAEGAAALDAEAAENAITYDAVNGYLLQEEYIASSEIVLSNPYGDAELAESLVERSEYDIPDDTWIKFDKVSGRYQPIWEKGLTLSYWIKVPADENGNYLPSSVLRWELLNQEYYQADDYAKHLACKFFDVEKTEEYMNYQAEDYANAAKEESKVIYGSEYYYKFLEYEYNADGTKVLDASGAPVAAMYTGAAGFSGPVYDSRYFSDTTGVYEQSSYYQFNPNFKRGYTKLADGSYEAQLSETVGGSSNYYSTYSTLDMEAGSWVRRADVDGELQIDVDNSIFWVPDNVRGINKNYNLKASYGMKAGMQNADVFFMNSWMDGQVADEDGDKTYDSALTWAVSPVTDYTDYNPEDGSYIGVKNGNVNEWHQVTVTLQNDWVEFYVDGMKADVANNYSSRGMDKVGAGGDSSHGPFKRLNKGTGLRYGYGSKKGAINFSYGNYVCRLLMDWITDEEATLHIGGAGQYAEEYAQAEHSNEFSLDDLKFYGQLLTEEQIVAAYEEQAAEMNAVADVTGAAVLDLSTVSDVSVGVENAVSTTTATINDKEVAAVNVKGNTKGQQATGAVTDNPFAGKDIEGATIGYWVKQDTTDRAAVLSFMDDEKMVSDLKGHSGEAQSMLYVQNDGTAAFVGGYTNSEIYGKLGNKYLTTADASTAAVMLENSAEWKYITITITNAGIKYYENGKLIENNAEDFAGPRFLDGYYQRLTDEANITTRYGAFGGTDNQCTRTLMDFITGEDTKLYFNYRPSIGGAGYDKTAGVTFAEVKYVDGALTDDQVKTLYANSCGQQTTTVITGSGDVDGNGDVELKDAQAALKIALKIEKNPTAEQIAAADIDGNGTVELKDAQAILKEALKITEGFKEKK